MQGRIWPAWDAVKEKNTQRDRVEQWSQCGPSAVESVLVRSNVMLSFACAAHASDAIQVLASPLLILRSFLPSDENLIDEA